MLLHKCSTDTFGSSFIGKCNFMYGEKEIRNELRAKSAEEKKKKDDK